MSYNYFIFDENRCVNCEACVVACVLENGQQESQTWRNIFSKNKNKLPGLPLINLSLSCNHCDEAPCLKNCPSLAYTKDDVTGAVLINSDQCLGCGYCIWQCPYESPKLNPINNVIEKCNFCNDRLAQGKMPSCAMACPTGALGFSFDEMISGDHESVTKSKVDTKPSIKINRINKLAPPEIDDSLFSDLKIPSSIDLTYSKLSLIKELPLLIFTFVVSLLVAVSASEIMNSPSILVTIMFITTGIASAVISMYHLGKKRRFFRSVLNIHGSWLSREIFFFTLYFILSVIDLLFYPVPNFIIVLTGLLTLLSIDLLYKPLQWKWKYQWHSGQVILITTSIFLLLNGFLIPLLIVMLLRLLINFTNGFDNKQNLILIIMRYSVLALVITFLLMDYHPLIIVVLFLIGEVIDRFLFYKELNLMKNN